MKVNVKQSLKTDVASALKLCTDQKSQEAVYAKLPGSNLKIKREGKAPNVRLRVSRTMPANPPAAIKRLVPATNEVFHTEAWRADGNGHVADIAVGPTVFRGELQSLDFSFRKHFELVSHALAGKVHGLEFERAPIHWLPRWMNQNVVDAADEIA